MKLALMALFLALFGTASCIGAQASDINTMKKFADNGNSYAQYDVGKYYYEAGNKEVGKGYLQRACDGKYYPACEYLLIKELGSAIIDSASAIGRASYPTTIDTPGRSIPLWMLITGGPTLGAAAVGAFVGASEKTNDNEKSGQSSGQK